MNILYRLDDIPHEIRKEIIELYLSGKESVSMIRLTYDISADTLYKLLHKYDVKLRSKYKSRIKVLRPSRRIGQQTKKLHKALVKEAISEFQNNPRYTPLTLSRTIPDAIIIDWENRTITAIEAETSALGTLKERAYTSPIFDKPFDKLIIKTRNGDSKTIDLTKNIIHSTKQ